MAILNLWKDLFTIRNSLCREKTKPWLEQKHLASGHFMKLFYKITTCPRWALLSGPKVGALYRFGCTLIDRRCLLIQSISITSHLYIFLNAKIFTLSHLAAASFVVLMVSYNNWFLVNVWWWFFYSWQY